MSTSAVPTKQQPSTTGRSTMTPQDVRITTRQEARWAFIAIVVATIAWTLFAGKDSSWDLFNHHLYLPFSLLSGRFHQDLFAAGPQSYQNPLGYVPFYLLVRANLPSWLIGVFLAAGQAALVGWGLHRIARSIWGDEAEHARWRVLALLMAWCAPVFLIVAGTSSIDPLCAGLILMAAAAVLAPGASVAMVLAGGILLGLSVALKPTSVVFALAIGVAGLVRCLVRQWTWPVGIAFVAASVAGLMLGAGYWSLWLWEAFRSPTFPLFNQYFASPYAPTGPTVAFRFMPSEPLAWFARIWEMAEFRSYTVTEAFVPDVRPILMVLGAVVLGALTLFRRRWRTWLTTPFWARSDVQLGVIALVSYLLWMATSGNARYAVTWFILVGLMLVRVAQLLLPTRYALLGLGAVVLIQAGSYAGAGDRRFVDVPWDSRPYMAVTVSPKLLEQPFLHLSLGVQSYASVAPYLHPGGALVNVSGQMTIPADGPLGEALQARLAAWEGRVRFLFLGPPRLDDPEVRASTAARTRFLTYRIGLAINWDDCEKLWISGDAYANAGNRQQRSTAEATSGTPMLSCAAMPAKERDAELDAQIARAESVFALLEVQCPRVFGPRPMASDIGQGVIQRRYMNTDARVNVSPTDGVTLAHFRSMNAVSLGSIDEVIGNRGRDACKAWQRLSIQ